MRSSNKIVAGLIGLLCGILLVLWLIPLKWDRALRGQNDFPALYTGGLLIGTPDLYSETANQAIQQRVADTWMPLVLFNRLPFYALFLKPLTWIDYRVAYAIFECVSLLALLALLRISAPGDKTLWFLGGLSIPVATALVNGQDVIIVTALFGACLELHRRGKPFLAGIVLSLCTIKFHLFLFVPLALLVRREWKTACGGATGAAFLALVSTVAQGTNWVSEYLRFLQRAEDPTPYTMPNLRGILRAFGGDNLTLEWLLGASVGIAVLYIAWTAKDFETPIAASVLAGLLTSHHGYIKDCVLLLIPAAIAARHSTEGQTMTRSLSLILLAPPAYFLLLADGPASALLPILMVVLLGAPILDGLRSTNLPATKLDPFAQP